jgi:hypothetical protein
VLLVVGIVDERAQKNPVPCREVFQKMVRTNLVPLVRRVRQAMDEVEEVGQGYGWRSENVRATATGRRKWIRQLRD